MIGLLLRLYPGRWRDRYGEELKSLVSETGLGPAAVIDITRAAAQERQRSVAKALAGGMTMTVGPARRHPTGWAVVAFALMAPTVIFVIGSMLAYQLGIGTAAMDSANAWLNAQPRLIDLLLVLAPAIALVLAIVPLLRLDLSSGNGGELLVGVRLRRLNVLVSLIALAVGGLLVWHIVWESVLQVGG